MPALNFKAQFAPLVESGTKRQTIRAPRKDGRDPKAGDVLYLYTGQRTKQCRKLGLAICTASYAVEISATSAKIAYRPKHSVESSEPAFLDGFAHADGFTDWVEMRDWFASVHGLPFVGYLIKW